MAIAFGVWLGAAMSVCANETVLEALAWEREDPEAPIVDDLLHQATLAQGPRPDIEAYLHLARRAAAREDHGGGLSDLHAIYRAYGSEASIPFRELGGYDVGTMNERYWSLLAGAHTRLARTHERFYVTALNALVTHCRLRLALRPTVPEAIPDVELPYVHFYLGHCLALSGDAAGARDAFSQMDLSAVTPTYAAWVDAWSWVWAGEAPVDADSLWAGMATLLAPTEVAEQREIPLSEADGHGSAGQGADAETLSRISMRLRVFGQALRVAHGRELAPLLDYLEAAAQGDARWLLPELVVDARVHGRQIAAEYGDPLRFDIVSRGHAAAALHAYGRLAASRNLRECEASDKTYVEWKLRSLRDGPAILPSDAAPANGGRNALSADSATRLVSKLRRGADAATPALDAAEKFRVRVLGSDAAEVLSLPTSELRHWGMLLMEAGVASPRTEDARVYSDAAQSLFNHIRGDSPFYGTSDPLVLASLADALWNSGRVEAAAVVWTAITRRFASYRHIADTMRLTNDLMIRRGADLPPNDLEAATRWRTYIYPNRASRNAN